MADLGKNLFSAIIILEGILCALMAPTLTAGAITIEKEQQTLELLLLTRLSNVNIVLGKYLSALSFIFITLICALPVAAISFLLGGVSPAQLGCSLAVIMSTVALFGAIGIYCSARFSKTATANAVAFLACLGWLALVPLMFFMVQSFEPNYPGAIYLPLSAAISLLLAMLPAVFLHSLLMLFGSRDAARIVFIIAWLGFAGPLFLFLATQPEFFNKLIDSPVALIGNPVVAMAELLYGQEMGLTRIQSITSIEYAFISVLLLLLGTAAILLMTVSEVRRLRNS
jgi:ABC-type transport system involved in multi-copper enzyme maturation permease subunit